MNIDSAPFKHFVVLFVAVGVVLVIAIIAGAAGPSYSVNRKDTLYKCPNGSHVWDDTCKGPEFGIGKTFDFDLPSFAALNRFWEVDIRPYNVLTVVGNHPKSESVTVTVVVNVSSRATLQDKWKLEVKDKRHKLTIKCPVVSKDSSEERGLCSSYTAALEEVVDVRHHRLSFRVEDVVSSSGKALLGDHQFSVTYGSLAYSNMEMGINITFLITGLIAFVLFLFMLRDYIYNGWTYQQVWTLVLLLGVVLFNNPFFALEYLIPGTFFLFVDALFKNGFIALLLLFWMASIEELRETETFNFRDKKHIPKFIIVMAYLLFSVIAYTGESAELKSDPVGAPMHKTPLFIAFFVLAFLSFLAGVGYTGYLGYRSLKAIASDKQMFTRLCFIAIPTAVVSLAIFIGACSGGYGTGATGTFEFIFFAFLYNLYTWVLVAGYWPVSGRYTSSNARMNDESASFIGGNKVAVDADDEETPEDKIPVKKPEETEKDTPAEDSLEEGVY